MCYILSSRMFENTFLQSLHIQICKFENTGKQVVVQILQSTCWKVIMTPPSCFLVLNCHFYARQDRFKSRNVGTNISRHFAPVRQMLNIPKSYIKYLKPIYLHSASVSPSTLARLVSRWATPAGSCTAWSTASSLTVTCPARSPLEATTTPSPPSSARLATGSTSPEPSLSTWSRPWLVSFRVSWCNLLFFLHSFSSFSSEAVFM